MGDDPAGGAGALIARGLRKSYGERVALAGVDLALARGEVMALVGPNGAGKTTLLSAIAGLVRPDSGSIAVMGIDALARPAAARRQLGLAPQRLGLTPTLTVGENLSFFARLGGMRPSAVRSRVAAVAEALAIADLLNRRAGRLSGGEQRRAHVACAIVHRPPVLLLDEPTSGVDLAGRQALLDLVGDLARQDVAVCFSTHQLEDAEDLGTTVTILHRGVIVARDDVNALLARHGRTIVELRFDAPVAPPPSDAGLWQEAVVDGATVRLATTEPGPGIEAVLSSLGPYGPRLRSVDVAAPGLATAFLALTGERYGSSEPPEGAPT